MSQEYILSDTDYLSSDMKKTIFLIIVAIIVPLMSIVLFNEKKETAPKAKPKEAEQIAKPDNTMIVQQLNQVIWVTTRVMEYNDARVLEEANQLLSESYLDMNLFEDPTLIEMVSEVRDLIVKSRINEGDRKIMEQEIAARRANALWNAMTGVRAGGLGASSALNLVVSAVQSYSTYRRELSEISRQFEQEKWKLDSEELKYLNTFQTNLLREVATLVREHKFPDQWRLSMSDASALIVQLKGDDEESVLAYLQSEKAEETYQYLPEYWFHRGMREMKAAMKNPNNPDLETQALQSFRKYQEMHVSFRRSRDEVLAAAGVISLIQKQFERKKIEKAACVREIHEQIGRINKYSDAADLTNTWQDGLIIHDAYKWIGERDKAREHLLALLTQLQNASSSMILEDLNTPRTNKRMKMGSLAEPIAVCIAILNSIETPKSGEHINRMEDIINSEYTAIQTKAEFYGTISKERQEAIITENTQGITCKVENNEVTVEVPWRFFLLQDVRCELWAYKDDTHSEYYVWNAKKTEHVGKGHTVTGVKFTFAMDQKDIKTIEFDILHNRMPVGLVYDIDDKKQTKLRAVRYGAKSSLNDRRNRFSHWKKL